MANESAAEAWRQEGGAVSGASCGSSDCCRRVWLAALTLAENVLLDDVYDRVQSRSPHEAVRECVLAVRTLCQLADTRGRSYCSG